MASLLNVRPLRVGVFGSGAMGRHHVRLLSQLPGAELVGVYDPRAEAAESVAREHGARAFRRLEDLGSDEYVLRTTTTTFEELDAISEVIQARPVA